MLPFLKPLKVWTQRDSEGRTPPSKPRGSFEGRPFLRREASRRACSLRREGLPLKPRRGIESTKSAQPSDPNDDRVLVIFRLSSRHSNCRVVEKRVIMKTRTDRKPLFERLKTGMEEAIRHSKGELTLKATVIELPDPPPVMRAEEVVRLRLDHEMSQALFARLLNVSIKTVQSWEQGTRKPSQAALRLIQIFGEDLNGLLRVAGMSGTRSQVAVKRRPSKPTGKRY
jgi:putative transcriptional regulator